MGCFANKYSTRFMIIIAKKNIKKGERKNEMHMEETC